MSENPARRDADDSEVASVKVNLAPHSELPLSYATDEDLHLLRTFQRAIDKAPELPPESLSDSPATPESQPALATVPAELDRWEAGVAAIRQSPELREAVLRSVMSSMECEGFEVDREQSERLLDEALNGPPLKYRDAS